MKLRLSNMGQDVHTGSEPEDDAPPGADLGCEIATRGELFAGEFYQTARDMQAAGTARDRSCGDVRELRASCTVIRNE